MPPLVPNRFLVRLAHPCPFVPDIPRDIDEAAGDAGPLLDLPESARLTPLADLDARPAFADVRLAWNEFGLGVQVDVTGKAEAPVGDGDKPRGCDGLWLFLDTRDARTSHRASRFCHHFLLLATGGGPEKDQPFFTQLKINRALQDAPQANPDEILFRGHRRKDGYRLEAFLPSTALCGYDPREHPRLGVCYVVRDQELGDQFLSLDWDFPFSEDPSLWDVLELIR